MKVCRVLRFGVGVLSALVSVIIAPILDAMTYQILHEPDQELPHSVYELKDLKSARLWRKSFLSEAEAHRWINANSGSPIKKRNPSVSK